MRQGELLGLPWSAVDLDSGTLSIGQALQRVDRELRIVEPKTNSSRRTIALSQQAVAALRDQRQRQRYERLQAGAAWEGERWNLVFTDPWGQPLPNYAVTARFQRDLTAAGLPRFRFHDTRHTFATTLIRRGVSPRVVKELLGHASITVTLDLYADVMPDQERAAADLIDQVLTAI
jgi:integrase